MTLFYKTFRLGISSVFTLFIVSGCLENDWDEKEQQEQEIIQQYLTSNNISEESKTAGGIYYIEEVAGTGLSPVKDNYIIINYTGRYLETNEIQETSYSTLKDDWALSDSYTYYVYGPAKFLFGYTITGLNEGISLMKEGGKSKMIIPSDKAFYDFNPLVYEIELLKVIKDPAAYEDSVLNVYLNTKGFDAETKLDNIWFKETVTPNVSDQQTVETGDTVLFWFTGRLLDGYSSDIKDDRVFDTNIGDSAPIKLVFDKEKALAGTILAIPPGLITALDSMRAGTHATAVLPYSEAFDDDGLVHTTQQYTIVPKYQTVIYDIVVEEIRSSSGK